MVIKFQLYQQRICCTDLVHQNTQMASDNGLFNEQYHYKGGNTKIQYFARVIYYEKVLG